MTFNYKNVYINNTATITGPYEAKGPLSKYFDKSYNDLYFDVRDGNINIMVDKNLQESLELS